MARSAGPPAAARSVAARPAIACGSADAARRLLQLAARPFAVHSCRPTATNRRRCSPSAPPAAARGVAARRQRCSPNAACRSSNRSSPHPANHKSTPSATRCSDILKTQLEEEQRPKHSPGLTSSSSLSFSSGASSLSSSSADGGERARQRSGLLWLAGGSSRAVPGVKWLLVVAAGQRRQVAEADPARGVIRARLGRTGDGCCGAAGEGCLDRK
ncbi:hypothetical protein NL676_025435 [Syzygium grande]|nr:hypothetical protein NL676_025435 [Syzygium grande]